MIFNKFSLIITKTISYRQVRLISLLGWVELVACNDCAEQATETDLSVVELEPEIVLGDAECLSCGDCVSQVLEEVEHIIELPLRDGGPSVSDLIQSAFVTGHADIADFLSECLLFFRGLDYLHDHKRDREDQTHKPEECRTLACLFLVDALEELDLGEDLQVIEDPVEEETNSAEDVEDLFVLGCLGVCDHLLDLLVLDD